MKEKLAKITIQSNSKINEPSRETIKILYKLLIGPQETTVTRAEQKAIERLLIPPK